MPMTPEAEKQYKPRRTPGSLDDVIYPETREKIQAAKREAADRKTDTANEAAFNKASGMKKGGMPAKYMSFSNIGKPSGMKLVTKMAKGGVTRADGCISKGHTKGRMV